MFTKNSENLKFTYIGNGKCVLSGRGTCKDDIIIVPATYNGDSVIAVDAGAFKNDLTIKGIILPGSVETIRNNAFYGCALLEVFSGIGVKRVDEQAFRGCTGVRCFATGILNEIGTGAFFDANIY